jgi:transcriptional regulator with XRE-family HTH domain
MKPRSMARVEINAELGACLKRARERRRHTQATLAQRLGVTVTAISRVENGQRDLIVAEFEAYARALGVRASTVLRAAEER